MGFEWKTEIKLPDNLYPDVIFHIPFLQKAIAMEVDGMMDRQEYFYKADFRQYKYYRAGFEEFKDVVFYRLSDARSFDLTAFTRIIELAIEINASCIVRNSI